VKPESTKFIGIDNYVRMLSDPTISQSFISTFKFALIAIPVTMFASLGFALLLNSPKLAFKGPLRTLVYMPIMIPLVASTLVWLGFLNTETGWLNAILGSLGLPEPDWINSEAWIYPALSVIGLDDIDFAESTLPPLTTIRLSRADLARAAFDALRAQTEGSPKVQREFLVSTSLVVRGSTGAPPAQS